MRQLQGPSLGWIGVAALALGVLLSGCGVTSTTHTGQGEVTNSPTPWPTAAATATPPSWPIPESAGCPSFYVGSAQAQYATLGALKVSIPARVFDYPSALMPNAAPNAPYQIAANAVTNYQPNPPVNPSLLMGYDFQFCNQTTASHTLTSLSVTIASFTPSSGPVNVWHLCTGGPYNAATKQTTDGCGGGMGGDIGFLAATLPSDSTGASAPATANPKIQYGGATLPASIGPNTWTRLVVAINGLTSQGTYALRFDISVDGASPSAVTPGDGPFLIAPSAAVWTGTACRAPAMQAQIPAASQDTYYVCPPAA